MAARKKGKHTPVDPQSDLHRVIVSAFLLGRVDLYQSAIESGELEAPGIIKRSLEGQRDYFGRVLDETVQRMDPHKPYMREGVIEDIIQELHPNRKRRS